MAVQSVKAAPSMDEVIARIFVCDTILMFKAGDRHEETVHDLVTLFLDIIAPYRDRSQEDQSRTTAAEHLGLVEGVL